ncbi:hypothetical protein [Streptomyces ortus]|uniref:Uncharacterized protein n=1 Tax=Streptomyces ortus TaxID=2867268 RepID=A0ABT3UW82_9ACTN|nr:hypothetical protein [Streptomyces ortus]MCX4231824.1 hypothetical protein [Streptomyces ortus]
MLFAGFVHSSVYYGYFHLESSAIGFDSVELALRSLRLVTFPVLITLALAVVLPRLPELLPMLGVPAHLIHHILRAGRAVARAYLAFVAAGIVLMLLWRYIHPFVWTAPLLVACGLVLGQTSAAAPAPTRRGRPWTRVLPVAGAALFLMWVVALAAGQLGRQDAERDAERIEQRVAVLIHSTEQLSITGPAGLKAEDLGEGFHYRYRYSGLRLLVERDHRYYLLPLGWNHNTDPTYVIDDDESIRVELRPGTQPRQ